MFSCSREQESACRCIVLCAHSDSLLDDLTSLDIQTTVTSKKLCTSDVLRLQSKINKFTI